MTETEQKEKMEKIVPSKWDYIVSALTEMGYQKCIPLAQNIRKKYNELYGYDPSPAWIEFITNPRSVDLYEIITSESFCTPCSLSTSRVIGLGTDRPVVVSKCQKCNFGAVAGRCAQPNSLFFSFLSAFRKEREEKEEKLRETQ